LAYIQIESTKAGGIENRKDLVAPPQFIRTVKHKAWQAAGFPIPKALIPVVCEMFRERLRAGVLEPCYRLYRNPWFLVEKKNKKYRVINTAMEYNKYTTQDTNLPLLVDKFSEEFAGGQLASLVDFFSGYDQVSLDEKSRDLTVTARNERRKNSCCAYNTKY
jgi:hypothetical protein